MQSGSQICLVIIFLLFYYVCDLNQQTTSSSNPSVCVLCVILNAAVMEMHRTAGLNCSRCVLCSALLSQREHAYAHIRGQNTHTVRESVLYKCWINIYLWRMRVRDERRCRIDRKIITFAPRRFNLKRS
jgi:hypothetical protein